MSRGDFGGPGVGQIEVLWLHRSPTAADRGSTQKREPEIPSETQIPGGQLHLGVLQ